MKRFAVNVVILPPDPVMNLVLEWNRKLLKTNPTNIALNLNNYLPHISLVMGCLGSDKLRQTQTILKSIATQHQAIELYVSGIRTVDTPENRVVTFDMNRSPSLTALHVSVVNNFKTLLTQDATDEDVYDPPPIAASAIEWINRFIPHQSFEHFWPHITLGFGTPPETLKPFTVRATRLAICHLGNHCTCRKILIEEQLV